MIIQNITNRMGMPRTTAASNPPEIPASVNSERFSPDLAAGTASRARIQPIQRELSQLNIGYNPLSPILAIRK